MGSIELKQFYPGNGVTDANEATANYNAIEGSTSGLNADNVAGQALERSHFNMSGGLQIKDSHWQTNGYELALGSTVATDAKYPTVSNSNPTSPDPNVTNLFDNLIFIVNHDENGNDSNVYNKGTKIPVGGMADSTNTNGVSLNVGDVVHIFWSINCWAFEPQHTNTIADYPCILIDTASGKGTIMDHSFVFYPRLNCVDGQPLESNFKKIDDATYGISNDSFDEPADGVIRDTATNPNRCASGTIGGNGVKAFSNGNRKDHWSWTPIMMGAGGNASAKEDLAFHFNGPAGNTLGTNELGGPRMHSGQVYIEVDRAQTLYGIQLYTTGALTTHKQSPSQDPQERNGVTIEDNAVISSQGGFDGDLSIESTSIGYIIYRKESN